MHSALCHSLARCPQLPQTIWVLISKSRHSALALIDGGRFDMGHDRLFHSEVAFRHYQVGPHKPKQQV